MKAIKNFTMVKKTTFTILLFTYIYILFTPLPSLAQDPTAAQPEFKPSGNTGGDMVNLLTGDLNYSVPILQIPSPFGGFPVILTYDAGIKVDDIASWVGLGWNINPGAITRNKKGFPDDWYSKEIRSYYRNEDLTGFKYAFGYLMGIDYSEVTKSEIKKTYGSLYTKHARQVDANYQQLSDYLMDVYENPFDPASFRDPIETAKSNTLCLPDYDAYEVNAPGLGGIISPKLFEFGTLSGGGEIMHKWGSNNVRNEVGYNSRYSWDLNKSKVNFYFEREHNSYAKLSLPPLGINYSIDQDVLWGPQSGVTSDNPYNYPNYTNNTEHRFKAGKHIQWYTLNEQPPPGCMLYHSIADVFKSYSVKGIGGFSITNESGFTYHFGLPVCQFEEFYYSEKTSDPDNHHYRNSSLNQYAYAWLLTAITGPDFIDNGIAGIVDDEDKGYWVKFDYGKWSDGYIWRTPYSGYEAHPSASEFQTYGAGAKQIYYLNSIKTATHTAFFVKGLRNDAVGKSIVSSKVDSRPDLPYESITINDANHKLLKLEKIILLNNEDAHLINKVNTSSLIPQKNGEVRVVANPTNVQIPRVFGIYYQNNVVDIKDIESNISQIESKAITIIDFTQDYELCKNSPDSPGGKLTLNSFKMYGKNKTNILPSYKFKYKHNPPYSTNKDHWGYYSASEGDNSAKPDVDAWSLHEITLPSNSKIIINYESDTYSKLAALGPFINNLYHGGGLRVSELILEGENEKYTTKYSYNNLNTGFSSGVTSFSPNYKFFIPYEKELIGPQIMYEYVTVENFGINNASMGKTQYRFDVLQLTNNYVFNQSFNLNYSMGHHFSVRNFQHIIAGNPSSENQNKLLNQSWEEWLQTPVEQGFHIGRDQNNNARHYYLVKLRTALITDFYAALGRILEVTKYNKFGHLVESTFFDYYLPSELKAGIKQESFDQFKRYYDWSSNHIYSRNVYCITLTSKISYPNVLKKVTKTSNNLTSIIEYGDMNENNNGFDFLTGAPLITKTYDAHGIGYKSVLIPAYHDIYPGMGSKAENPANKNMLIQKRANYSFVKVNNADKLIEANLETWKNSWNYRKFNASSSIFYDETLNNDIWRKHQSYVWNSIPDADGTISQTGNQTFVDFNWGASNQSEKWIKTSEATRYDNNSRLLESVDINGLFNTSKSNNNSLPVASSDNVSYIELVYTGAEGVSSGTYLEGEVLGADLRFDARFNNQYAHTGDFSIKLTSSREGFKYAAPVGLINTFKKGKKYKAFVWIRKDNSSAIPTAASLNYRILSGSTVVLPTVTLNATAASTIKAGNWYLLNIEIDIPVGITADKIEIWTASNSSDIIYMDDFRIAPLGATMSSFVYDEKQGLLVASLDESNFGTKYVYDASGKVIEVYKEFTDRNGNGGFIKVKENSYNFSRGLND